VGIEVWRQQDLRDPRRLPEFVAGEGSLLGDQVVLLANGDAVREIVAAIGPELPLDDMVGVAGRAAADAAFASVARENGLPEIVSGEQAGHGVLTSRGSCRPP